MVGGEFVDLHDLLSPQSACRWGRWPYAPLHFLFLQFFDPRDPGTQKIMSFHKQIIKTESIFAEIGFQKLHIGRGSVPTKYEPVASRVDPV